MEEIMLKESDVVKIVEDNYDDILKDGFVIIKLNKNDEIKVNFKHIDLLYSENDVKKYLEIEIYYIIMDYIEHINVIKERNKMLFNNINKLKNNISSKT